MAHRHPRALALCSLLVLLDCSPAMQQPCIPGSNGNVGGFGGGFSGTGGGDGTEPIFLAGSAVDLTLNSFASTECEPRWTVEGEVLDPQNQPLTAEFIRSQDFGGLASARVRFTPPTPGSYLVTARFEPSIARVQRIVQVARNRSGDPRLVDAMPFDPSQCGRTFRTLRGSVVCQRSANVAVVRSGAILESFSDTTASVVGNTVWLVTPQRLERRVDTGVGPLVLQGSVPAKNRLSANASFFEDDRAIVLDGSDLRGPLVWDGTRLVDEQRPFLGGNGLLLGPLALSFDGDSVCDASADAGVCAHLTPVGVQGDVLWEWEGLTLSYRVGRPTAPASVFPLSASVFVDALGFPVAGNQTPRLRTTTGETLFTITLTPTGPVLEQWPWETSFTRDFGLVATTVNSLKWIQR